MSHNGEFVQKKARKSGQGNYDDGYQENVFDESNLMDTPWSDTPSVTNPRQTMMELHLQQMQLIEEQQRISQQQSQLEL